MENRFTTEAKVGFFVIAAILGIIFLSVTTADLGFSLKGHYPIYLQMKSADGITHKTPVQVSGIPVGFVSSVELMENNHAKIGIKLKREVVLKGKVAAFVRSRGVLGDTYIELQTKGEGGEVFSENGVVTDVQSVTDINDLAKSFGEISQDVRVITQHLRIYVESQDALIPKILKNMEVLTRNVAALTTQNSQHISSVLNNLNSITTDLRYVVRSNSFHVEESMSRLANITRKIDEGQGTVGKLINDDSTVKKMNEVADNLNSTLGGIARMKATVGWHLEYLGTTKDFKNYVTLNLAPKPDKYFLFEVVSDSDPSATTKITTSRITAGGTTSTVVTEEDVVDRNKVLFSAQIAKKIHDVTLRGGIIESTGGVGVDYSKGPVDLKFSAFDFRNDLNQRPHLKFLTNVHVTDNFSILGGVDDFISKQHDPDWFVGAGIQFDDDDIKSILGLLTVGK